MLVTSTNVLFPGHNYLLTTGTDDPTLSLLPEHQRVVRQGRSYHSTPDREGKEKLHYLATLSIELAHWA